MKSNEGSARDAAMSVSRPGETTNDVSSIQRGMQWLIVLGLVYLLMVAVGVLSQGFRAVSGGADGAAAIFEFANNPLVGVVLGVLATALVQSSSAVTSVIVGLVGGGLPVAIAIPMIMGSNMGTTVTNTLAALGNLREDKAFNRSFAAATIHDFFNLFTILIFLPLELLFHPLERLSGYFAKMFQGAGDASVGQYDFVRTITRPVISEIRNLILQLPDWINGFVMILVGIIGVLGVIYALNTMLRAVMTGRARRLFNAAIGKNAALAVLSGLITTLIVQSSTLTTVLIVPMAGAGIFTLAQVYPFTLGANIGTPITALLSATAVTGEYKMYALQIALVHLLYNSSSVVLFASIPSLWRLPMRAAQALADGAERNRWVVPSYILGVFFVLPGIVFGAQALFNDKNPQVIEAEANKPLYDAVRQETEKKGVRFE
jgi:solute carrier family 34 (sodium-dependent phosphate cotransporter)